MDGPEIKGNPQEILTRLVAPFFEQGTSPVYAARCCGRLFAGAEYPKKCRACDREPAYATFESQDDAVFDAIPEQPEYRNRV